MSKDKCDCCERTTERSEAERKKLINRLSRIEGQIRGIRKMVERNAYCPDILTQCAAASAALNAFNREDEDGAIEELVQTVQKLMK